MWLQKYQGRTRDMKMKADVVNNGVVNTIIDFLCCVTIILQNESTNMH